MGLHAIVNKSAIARIKDAILFMDQKTNISSTGLVKQLVALVLQH